MYTRACVYIYIYIYTHVYIYIPLSLSLSIYIYIYIYTHAHLHICIMIWAAPPSRHLFVCYGLVVYTIVMLCYFDVCSLFSE